MRVRESVPDDAEGIARVHVRSVQEGFADMFPVEELARIEVEPRVPLWRERLPLVAEEAGKIVGFAHIGPSDEEPAGEVYRFFVLPERWGKGIGRALMACALDQLRTAGFSEALLWVHAANSRARRFYEASGWRVDGAEKKLDQFGMSVTEIRYRIALLPDSERAHSN